MFDDDFRQQLRSACSLFGGIMAVANQAGVDDGNLSRWLRGKGTLSDEKVSRVLDVMGLPNGEPVKSIVHTWFLKNIRHDYSQCMRPYFPNGAKIARAPWATVGPANIRRALQIGKTPPSVYLITDETVRAVLRLSPGILVQKENLKDFIKWRDGSRDESVLDISEDDALWAAGDPTSEEFDALWQGMTPKANRAALMEAIRDEGISFEEAIRRIRSTK